MKHGETAIDPNGSPEYRAWVNMRRRCLYNKAPNWKNYGGRGIGIDPVWDDYSQFLADMGRKPRAGLSLERLRNNDNYGPSNCIWASRAAQQRNKRTTKLTSGMVNQIRNLYIPKVILQRTLASMFGVSQQEISSIINRRMWK